MLEQSLRSYTTSKRNAGSAHEPAISACAVRSFFQYIAFETPGHAAHIQQVLAIPGKRYTRRLVNFLTRPEAEALLGAPDLATPLGRRDHALILLALQTGLRLSELISLSKVDVSLQTGSHVRVIGKGRKERCIPLAKPTIRVLKACSRNPGAARARQCSLTPAVSN